MLAWLVGAGTTVVDSRSITERLSIGVMWVKNTRVFRILGNRPGVEVLEVHRPGATWEEEQGKS